VRKLFVFLVVVGMLAASCGSDDGAKISIILEPLISGASLADLERARDVIDKRLEELGLGSASVSVEKGRLEVRDAELGAEGEKTLTRPGRLMFCEPIVNHEGEIAITWEGTVVYEPGTCDPMRDDQGNIAIVGATLEYVLWDPTVVTYRVGNIVWQPAKGDDGRELTGEFLKPTTQVREGALGLPILLFELTDEGGVIMSDVTARLASGSYPLAPFIDGEPMKGEDGTIIAPLVHGQVTTISVIEGLSRRDAETLSVILNAGVLPIGLKAVEP